MKEITCHKNSPPDSMQIKIERALTRAAKEARKVARFYGTPIYIQEKGGKVIAVKP